MGRWENVSFEDILASDPELLGLVRSQRAIWHRAPGGEAVEAFRKRVPAGMGSIRGRQAGGDVFVAAHGGVINAYLGPMLLVENEMFFLPENSSLNSVEVEGSERRGRC